MVCASYNLSSPILLSIVHISLLKGCPSYYCGELIEQPQKYSYRPSIVKNFQSWSQSTVIASEIRRSYERKILLRELSFRRLKGFFRNQITRAKSPLKLQASSFGPEVETLCLVSQRLQLYTSLLN